jgi:Ca-activated chloride channel family protein
MQARHLVYVATAATVLASLGIAAKPNLAAGPGPGLAPTAPASVVTPARKNVQIDLDKAIDVSLPNPSKPLTPAPFKTKDLKKGWIIEIPGDRPIATPTYYEGKLYVGGGYGSHEFYCFDAETGTLVWQIHTGDDGPTAAVAEQGLVAFNTESCTVMVVEASTGKLVWQEWLGDPLMSQPAIADGKLYIAYPCHGKPTENVQTGSTKSGAHMPNHMQQNVLSYAKPPSSGGLVSKIDAGMSQAKGGRHVMLCADLRTGKHIWTQDITGDVQSAPVVDGKKLLFNCFDGTSFCLSADNGKVEWQKHDGATSAPLSLGDEGVLVAAKAPSMPAMARSMHQHYKHITAGSGMNFDARTQDVEVLALQGATNGTIGPQGYASPVPVSYYKAGKSTQITGTQASSLDSSVGFGGGAPGAAQMHQAKSHLGFNTVAQAWSYQGARPAANKAGFVQAKGTFINSMDRERNEKWSARASGRRLDKESQAFAPPALGKKNMFLVSNTGHLISLGQEDGKVNFMYDTKNSITFQPALANGKMYVGTNNGRLMCLETGDPDADGWTAWGGNSQHNKRE